MIKQYLQLTRAHTAPLETVPAIMGASIATGSVLSMNVFYWAVFGLLYHLAGYGINSYLDWAKGYDKKDENKKHHPLNKGTLSPQSARVFVTGMFLLTVVWLIFVFTQGSIHSSMMAVLAICVGIASGLLYNMYGKQTDFKSIPISIAHTTVFASAYLYSGGPIEPLFWIMCMYVFVWVMYQIAVSGEMKDIMQDESNLLIALGSQAGDSTIYVSEHAQMMATAFDFAMFVFGTLAIHSLGGGWMVFSVFVLLMLLRYLASNSLMFTGSYNRKKRLRNMSSIEGMSLFGFVVICIPDIGWTTAAMICTSSLFWLVILNKIEWGTTISPRV